MRRFKIRAADRATAIAYLPWLFALQGDTIARASVTRYGDAWPLEAELRGPRADCVFGELLRSLTGNLSPDDRQ